MPSGIPVQIGGKWTGFTDFSEFAIQGPGAIPAGMTVFGGGAPNVPTVFSIINDPVEGNYLQMSGQDISRWGIGYNAFFGLIEFGEMLARVWIQTNTGNRRICGPALSMGGLSQAAFDIICGHVFKRTTIDFEAEVGSVIDGGSDGASALGDMIEAEQAGVWVWVRFARFGGSPLPLTTDQLYVKAWYGAYSAEPNGWNAVSIAVGLGEIPRGLLALGWGTQGVGDDQIQRIAFLAFSEDPILNLTPNPDGSAPAPGDIVAPTVTVNPLQDTWVGLNGSAFAVVP